MQIRQGQRRTLIVMDLVADLVCYEQVRALPTTHHAMTTPGAAAMSVAR